MAKPKFHIDQQIVVGPDGTLSIGRIVSAQQQDGEWVYGVLIGHDDTGVSFYNEDEVSYYLGSDGIWKQDRKSGQVVAL